jgi:hypothetical protein
MSAAAPTTTTPGQQLAAVVNSWYGVRGGDDRDQAPTVACGYLVKVTSMYVARQGGPAAAPGRFAAWSDARADYGATTRHRLGEMTGYHSEMLVIWSILKTLNGGGSPSGLSIDQARQLLTAAGGAVVAANAACCAHCSAMLQALGCSFAPASTVTSLTGWWNPLTDRVYAQASAEFARAIPGSAPSAAAPFAAAPATAPAAAAAASAVAAPAVATPAAAASTSTAPSGPRLSTTPSGSQ